MSRVVIGFQIGSGVSVEVAMIRSLMIAGCCMVVCAMTATTLATAGERSDVNTTTSVQTQHDSIATNVVADMTHAGNFGAANSKLIVPEAGTLLMMASCVPMLLLRRRRRC